MFDPSFFVSWLVIATSYQVAHKQQVILLRYYCLLLLATTTILLLGYLTDTGSHWCLRWRPRAILRNSEIRYR